MIKQTIQQLCEKYTSLTPSDIKELTKEALLIEKSSKYEKEDVFIDVLSDVTEEAIVVYHRQPRQDESIYQEIVVGKVAERLNEPGVYRTFETSLITEGLLAKTQENKLIRQKVFPIRNNKKTVGVLIVEYAVKEMTTEDIQYNKSHEKIANVLNAPKYSAYYREMIDQLDEAILIFDENGHLVLNNAVSNSYYYHFGYMESILGFHYDNLSLDTSTFEQLLYLKKAGKWKSVEKKAIIFGHSHFKMTRFFEESSGMLTMVLHDKTEMYNREVEIVEKSVAIKEIHHRVKNNLQSVVSLLRIQARRTDNAEVKKLLRESESRILAISATHELLSKQVDDDIPLYSVLDLTIANSQRTFLGQKQIEIHKKIDPAIYLNSDKAVSVALIVNELLQNSFEHGFERDDQTENVIDIKVSRMNEQMIEVVIQDNGVGYDKSSNKEGSLGLKIVSSYVKDKLKGRLKITSNQHGTKTYFCFKIK